MMPSQTTPTSRVALLIVDPQNSFCHPTEGELYVPGAEHDMERLAALIARFSSQIDEIHVTLDTHHELDVAHPVFWLNQAGNHPEPFTTISKQDVIEGTWKPFDPDRACPPYGTLTDRMIDYVSKLEENGRYQLTIWPPHCRLGTSGHTVAAPVQEALRQWELSRYAMVDYAMKGANIFTEHYSGVQADVPDAHDPDTQLNTALIRTLEHADLIVCGGEASSHCVANTIRDIVTYCESPIARKFVLLEDAMSPVPGFEHFAEKFFEEMRAKGMVVATTTSLHI